MCGGGGGGWRKGGGENGERGARERVRRAEEGESIEFSVEGVY